MNKCKNSNNKACYPTSSSSSSSNSRPRSSLALCLFIPSHNLGSGVLGSPAYRRGRSEPWQPEAGPRTPGQGGQSRAQPQPSPRPGLLTRALGSCVSARQLRGFYRGLSLPVCTVSLISSVSFGTYRHCLAHICRFRYGSPDAKPAKTDITLSGFASGVVRVSRVGARGTSGLQGWERPRGAPSPAQGETEAGAAHGLPEGRELWVRAQWVLGSCVTWGKKLGSLSGLLVSSPVKRRGGDPEGEGCQAPSRRC